MIAIKTISKELFLLVGAAVTTAMIFNFVSPNGIRLVPDQKTSGCVQPDRQSTDAPLYEFEIESAHRAKEIFDEGKAVFVDARDDDYYRNGHIKGAVSLPVSHFNQHIDQFRKKYPIGKSLIVYCYNKACRDSQKLAQLLFEDGYMNVSVFPEGFWEWNRKGFPVE